MDVFLLGGHDLEMLEIKNILEERGISYYDKGLNWSDALLSAYREELKSCADSNVYGVELREDIPAGDNYQRIDHHNDYSDRASSLEQVAALLGVELTRYQQLVAANDKGYIPAMKALGASDDEVAEVRRRDRAAQGVTEEDERLAAESAEVNTAIYNGIKVVRSLTSCFSPICDRLFPYRRLLIYTDAEWVFYGEGKAELVGLLDSDIKKGRVFYGGGDCGYIGAAKHAYSKTEIQQFVERIIKQYGSK